MCLARYEQYVRSRADLMAALHEIDDQVLGCWCHETPSTGSPMKCHGDVLIKLRAEQTQLYGAAAGIGFVASPGTTCTD